MGSIFGKRSTIIAGLAPALLVYVIFVILPIGRSFWYGFFDWNGLAKPIWIGLDNFRKVLADPAFWGSFRNNLFIVLVSVFGQIPIGLGLAVLLNGKVAGGRFYRFLLFMPMILSTVVVALLWSTILNYRVGLVNAALRGLGLAGLAHNWLGDPKTAMGTIGGVVVWQFFGFYMVIFLAALQNIPKEIHESAQLDGAGPWMRLTRITIPMIWGPIMASVALCIAGGMRTFDLAFAMTQGGPANSTELMAIYMYNKTFEVLKYGYGSAVSLVIFVLSFALILASRRLMAWFGGTEERGSR